MPYHSLYRLLGFGIAGEVWEVIAVEVRADGQNIHNFFRVNSGPVYGDTDLKVCLSVNPSVPFAIA
jgi:hypothetical protein